MRGLILQSFILSLAKSLEEIELEGGGAQSHEFAGEVLGGRDWLVRELSSSTREIFRPSLGNGRASSA